MTTELPYTKADVKFLRSIKVEPWHNTDAIYRRDYGKKKQDRTTVICLAGFTGVCCLIWLAVLWSLMTK